MHFIASKIYDGIIHCMVAGIKIYGLRNKKAAQWIQDRKALKQTVFDQLQTIPHDKQVIWFHCASLGEFEMAKPIIEDIRKTRSWSDTIVVTFFSPSGYRNALKYDKADIYAYLYPDTAASAKQWISLLRPDIVIWIKYEYWAQHLNEAKKSGARLILTNAHFSQKQIYFRLLKFWYLPILSSFERIFTLDLASLRVTKNNGLENCQVCGDTRIDRVLDNAKSYFDDRHIISFAAKKQTIVLGSVWPEDMNIISPVLPLLLEKYNFIVAPHEIAEHHIISLKASLPDVSCRYSKLDPASDMNDYQIMIIDNVGMLSKLYRVGTMAYVGGAFGNGMHNILEPLAYGIPVIFGPKISSRTEAIDSIKLGFGKSIRNSEDFTNAVVSLSKNKELKSQILSYLQANKGASSIISQYILKP